MNKRQRKKTEKRTIQYISELRKTDKQAWRETMLRRRRHAMVYFGRMDADVLNQIFRGRMDDDALNQIFRYNLLVYEMTEVQFVDYMADNGEPQLCGHRRRWLIKLCGERAPLVIDNLPTFPEFMAEARARLKSPGQEVRTLEDALTQGFAAGMETGQVYKVTNDRPAEIDLDNLTKAALKFAGIFEDLAKRTSETIQDLFQ